MRPDEQSAPPAQRRHWNDIFQPIPPPPAHGPPATSPTHSPVRDDSRLGPTEDLDRELDGVPHSVVALTATFSVMLSILLATIWFISSWPGRVGTIILLAVAMPVIITSLKRKAERDRDHVHPSR